MRVAVLGSGSSGNATLVEAGGTRVLVDAGFNPTATVRRLKDLGIDLYPRGLDAIVVTHEHGDHAGHVPSVAKRTGAPVYVHAGIRLPRLAPSTRVVTYDTTQAFTIGALRFAAFPVPHDAPQVALRIASADRTFALVTDLGEEPPGLADFLRGVDDVLLESNYCPELLAESPYPERLRARIRGPGGHLANAESAALLARLVDRGVGRVWLGHLSLRSNSPERALSEAKRVAPNFPVFVLEHGPSRVLHVGVDEGAVDGLRGLSDASLGSPRVHV
ncbi:MAG: MBL fold metallo-hydrolase [Polyangiaceae bacterium]